MGRRYSKRAATATWSGIGSEPDTLVEGICLDRFRQSNGEAIVEIPRGPLAAGSGEIFIDASFPQIGPYRLLEILGEGGMARVYLAEHALLGKRVAVKTLLPEFCTYRDAHDVLMREARIAAKIRHENVAEIHDFSFDERGCPYFVMELAAGETLARRLERGPLLLSQALDMMIRVADAVSAIHRAGYLHRDVKSENIICVPSGRRIKPVLIDFGIARPIGHYEDHLTSGLVGTPRTMAPEQIAQDRVDERTDIWAMGIMLYEMLTGDLPFSVHDNIRDDLVAIVTESPRPLPLGLGGDICRVVEACLNKDPEHRPQSASGLLARLRQIRSDYVSRNELIERTLREAG